MKLALLYLFLLSLLTSAFPLFRRASVALFRPSVVEQGWKTITKKAPRQSLPLTNAIPVPFVPLVNKISDGRMTYEKHFAFDGQRASIDGLFPSQNSIPSKGVEMFFMDRGEQVEVGVTKPFLDNHISFKGRRKFANVFPSRTTVIKGDPIVWDPPSALVSSDRGLNGRLKYVSKKPVAVDSYIHVGGGVYKKSGSSLKRLVAHGTRLNQHHVIDHLHGTLND